MSARYKSILKYAGIAVLFLVISYAFVPQVLSGKIVNQSDISGYVGMAREMDTHNAAHPDDPTAWSNSMFGGMPTTVISAPRQGDLTQTIYDFLLTGRRPATYLFISLLGAFLLMLAFGLDAFLAIGGAIAVTFCSYNLQIIQVGHNTKMQALAFLPWALAALVYTYKAALRDAEETKDSLTDDSAQQPQSYKSGLHGTEAGKGDDRKSVRPGEKRWLLRSALGAVLFGFATAFQVKANHQQITYYLALMIFAYAITTLVWILTDKERRKSTGRFFAASAFLLVMGLAGIGTNANKLIPIYKYTPYSMRGGSELATQSGGASKGLEMDYATAWSYGWQELPNLMIPNFNGGSSSESVKPEKSATYDLLKRAGQKNAREICKGLPMYWGPQPFTAGPMYMGAITVFLFLLGLFFCRQKEKWWIIICTLLSVFLGLGSHFQWFTTLFYKYAPFYNKFRTVSMALIMLQFTLPVLGFVCLDKVMKGGVSRMEFRKKGWAAFAVSGGFCLLCLLIPRIAGSFTASVDSGQQDILVAAFQQDREYLLRSDALRSLIFISLAFALILWGLSVPKDAKKSFSSQPETAFARRRTAALLICVLVLADLFSAGKRYLSDEDFVTRNSFNSQFKKRAVDEMILQDTDPSYRVLDLSVNTFNDSHPSYWHKCIGGYSPAKLQRYQELVDHYITKEIRQIYNAAQSASTVSGITLPDTPVLSMLNTRYIIFGDDIMPAANASAYGNAWFVNSAVKAGSPAEALGLIGQTDTRELAVIEDEDAWGLASAAESGDPDGNDRIELTYYAANELRYSYISSTPRLAVFSEVFYPEGWHAWIADSEESCPPVDVSAAEKARAAKAGTDVPVFRADWLLRAALLPAGEHTLIMRFDPESYSLSAGISKTASLALIIFLLITVTGTVVAERKSRVTTDK